MVYRLPAKYPSSLPITVLNNRSFTPLYSLHRKVGKRWLRISTKAYPLNTAWIVFGEAWGMNSGELSIRQVQVECLEAR